MMNNENVTPTPRRWTNVQLDLWARFVEKLIEQTGSGALKWDLRYSGEYERYAVCGVLGHEVWYCDRDEKLEIVEASGVRWTVPKVTEKPSGKPRVRRLSSAILDQVEPGPRARVEHFAREFLGEGAT